MDLQVSPEFIEHVGKERLDALLLHDFRLSTYRREPVSVNLRNVPEANLEEVIAIAKATKGVKGSGVVRRDVGAWLRIVRGEATTASTAKQMCSMVIEHYRATAERWIFKTNVNDATTRAWYVAKAVYTAPSGSGENRRPEYFTVTVCAFKDGEVVTGTVTAYAGDVKKKTLAAWLVSEGFVMQTAELMEQYAVSKRRFFDMISNIGLQLEGWGVASGKRKDTRYDWYNWRSIRLDQAGVPARLVVDVFNEGDEVKSNRRTSAVDLQWWDRKNGVNIEEAEAPSAKHVLPTQPILTCFDLNRHQHFRVHTDNVKPYEYDPKLEEKLILPQETLDLVRILVSTDSGYRDIIAGKSGGAVILSAGPPGVGKTLTAEVYAESMQLPLYTVQCAQLGTDGVALEQELARVLARASRWKAICLLDEADVYVMARGADLNQNAIVGVFLRLLERYEGTLFLTTNRGDLVDDAIASRCIARINYGTPSIMHQQKMWKVLADAAGAKISPRDLQEISGAHNDLTGRDIKNLLKLAMAVSKAKGTPITKDTVAFVKKFKPTSGEPAAAK